MNDAPIQGPIEDQVQATIQRAEARRARREERRAELASSASPAAALAGAAPIMGTADSNVLVAEGDSWFDYPGSDVLEELEDVHGYDVRSVAKHGATMEAMTYDGKQIRAMERCLFKLARRGRTPRAILLSGGGNDLADAQLAMVLNHANSGLPKINDDVVRGVIEVRLKAAYVDMVRILSMLCDRHFQRPDLPVLVHGYDYPVPDGRGLWSGLGPLPGPWLEPSFVKRGYRDLEANTETMGILIDRFNDMLATLSGEAGLAHVHYVNLRGTLDNTVAGEAYKELWDNELHPESEGFELVADTFDSVLRNL